ncbi:hypothetical protein [Leptolyngbya sp. NIES-2104]|uniref:hypothetical protein n=1 Tax=Leptolyngbya sp. NIES-2104 TaxID=1552121 RepID=UPI0006EC74B3|nr:hypothetical protein [Leptolyngbya sp. NIES-2104]GAP97116.1 hypothetical protein NIES2104_36630 [Leptolyngbya sp. NIES-2104]
MFGLTKSRTIVLGVSGVVLAGVLSPLANRVIAQVAPPPIDPISAPSALPVTPDVVPAGRIIPSPIPIPVRPSVITPTPRPALPTIRRSIRRIPIDPVPMPGERGQPLPALPATPDLRTMPGSGAALNSGISGRITLTPICSISAPAASCAPRPYTGFIKISTAGRDRVIRLYAGEGGAFQLRLAPGQYVIEPEGSNFPIGTRQPFTVVSSVMRQMEFNFQGTPSTAAAPFP